MEKGELKEFLKSEKDHLEKEIERWDAWWEARLKGRKDMVKKIAEEFEIELEWDKMSKEAAKRTLELKEDGWEPPEEFVEEAKEVLGK